MGKKGWTDSVSTAVDEHIALDGEVLLLWAIMHRAILDYVDDSLCREERREDRDVLQRKAKRWIFSESVECFSFLWICDHLDIDSYRWRQKIYDRRRATGVRMDAAVRPPRGRHFRHMVH